MAKRVTVQVRGLKQFRQTCADAGVDLEDLKAAMTKAAGLVEKTAIYLAPRRSGDLVDTIRSSGTKRIGYVRAGKKAVPYAGPIHWGWPERQIKPNRFVVEAARQTEPDWLPFIQDHIDQTLSKIKGA